MGGEAAGRLPRGALRAAVNGALQDGRVDLPAFADRLGMPLLHDEQAGLCRSARGPAVAP